MNMVFRARTLALPLALSLLAALCMLHPVQAQQAANTMAFDVASKLYEQGKQAEALVTLQQLAAAGDARAQYVVGLDLLEGKFIPRDNAKGLAYLILAAEDTQWGSLVAPNAREARALVEPQLSGPELIRADALVGAFKAKAAKK